MILRTAGWKAKNGMTSCTRVASLERLTGNFGPFGLQNQLGLSPLGVIRGLINSLEVLRRSFAIFPSAEVQELAHEVEHAGLDCGPQESALMCIWKAL